MSELSKSLRKLITNHSNERVRGGIDGDWVTIATTQIEEIVTALELLDPKDPGLLNRLALEVGCQSNPKLSADKIIALESALEALTRDRDEWREQAQRDSALAVANEKLNSRLNEAEKIIRQLPDECSGRGVAAEAENYLRAIPASNSPEREEYDQAVKDFRECSGVKEGGGGCGCTGHCLGNALAKVRRKFDDNYDGQHAWWSDQLHGWLRVRPGDSGRQGAPLNAENYWSGAQ